MPVIDSSLQRIFQTFLTVVFSLLLATCGGPLNGIVTSSEDNRIVISVGLAEGVREGDIFWVWRKVAVSNGGTVTARIGKIRIVKILGEHSALAEGFYGKAEPNDRVQRVTGGDP